MGSEGRLSPKKRKRLEGVLGEPLSFAIATHSGWVVAVTIGPKHRHIAWHRSTGEIEVMEDSIHWWQICDLAEAGEVEPKATR